MKTAISMPDDLFARVDAKVAELGISRSEFLADAARQRLDALAASEITARIDAALTVARPEALPGRSALAALTTDDEW
ncbi:ribbon-helix-helix domain-containing protein [Galbitalea sp. SE-J8]|uniref:CopG family ribbon-helix-helix protein n=1 Tax=Galbitalea sp. SE-J8 TaxID=3054952 RepID=UPI00259CA469|nr:ribbon-helix-helix domain-containing protein [Galbitalea sp. SE-J8]MDM4764269.1 ribbon-helix-helix domain-containing protein [Galbitalea sp. SE-J8]